MKTDKPEPKKEGLPVWIPLSTLRWAGYSFLFALLLFPFHENPLTSWQHVVLSFILGHFASQLNALINKK